MKRGLALPCVHSALPITRRARLQLFSVAQLKSRKRRAGLPLASLAACACAISASISAASRSLRARPNR